MLAVGSFKVRADFFNVSILLAVRNGIEWADYRNIYSVRLAMESENVDLARSRSDIKANTSFRLKAHIQSQTQMRAFCFR